MRVSSIVFTTTLAVLMEGCASPPPRDAPFVAHAAYGVGRLAADMAGQFKCHEMSVAMAREECDRRQSAARNEHDASHAVRNDGPVFEDFQTYRSTRDNQED